MTLQFTINGSNWKTIPNDIQPLPDNGINLVYYRILKDDGTVWGNSGAFEGIYKDYNEALNTLHRARRLTANRY